MTGRHSSLPKSMSNDRMIFVKSEKKEKFCVGPTLLRPGPILLIHVTTDENEVAKS